jgi:exosome complex component RRP45
MPREVELSTNECEFILTALRKGFRLDGRGADAYRGIELSFGEDYGVVDVKMGKTR